MRWKVPAAVDFCHGARSGINLRFCSELVAFDLTCPEPGNAPSDSLEKHPSGWFGAVEGGQHRLLSPMQPERYRWLCFQPRCTVLRRCFIDPSRFSPTLP